MMDREFYKAEELDAYVEAHQAGQVTELPPDLPVGEWRLADQLLAISDFARPDVRFLATLENQIHGAARKSRRDF